MAARGKKLLKVKRGAMFKHVTPRIKRDDQVQIITGNEKGKTGKVLRVMTSRQRVVIEGANMIFRHVKKSQQNPQGGRIRSESSVPLSNVALYCGDCGRGVRIRMQVDGEQKFRVCAKCGAKVGS